jgi:hypothetical protein
MDTNNYWRMWLEMYYFPINNGGKWRNMPGSTLPWSAIFPKGLHGTVNAEKNCDTSVVTMGEPMEHTFQQEAHLFAKGTRRTIHRLMHQCTYSVRPLLLSCRNKNYRTADVAFIQALSDHFFQRNTSLSPKPLLTVRQLIVYILERAFHT